VSQGILTGQLELSDCSVAARLSWAASRDASRIEDRAYSLLGIFDVFIPLIYGEGSRAFRRLQEEIIKRSNDLTIFAWDCGVRGNDRSSINLLADSPDGFAAMGDVVSFKDDFFEFSLTNKGVLVPQDIRIMQFMLPGRPGQSMYGMHVGIGEIAGGIFLRKIGPYLFQRCCSLPMLGFREGYQCAQVGFNPVKQRAYIGPRTYIIADPSPHTKTLWQAYRANSIHVPQNDTWELVQAAPRELWDATDRILLRRSTYDWDTYPIKVVCRFRLWESPASIDVLCFQQDHSAQPMLKVSQHHRMDIVSNGMNYNFIGSDPLGWPSDENVILWQSRDDTTEVRYPGSDTLRVRVSLLAERLPGMDELTTAYSLNIETVFKYLN
jgi:hypothetical protein